MTTLFLVASISAAQDVPDDVAVPDINAQAFRPSIDSEYTIWTDDSGRIIEDGTRFGGRFSTNYANDPFVVLWATDDGEEQRTELVSDAWMVNLLGSVQYDRFRVGLDLPVYLLSAGELTNNGAGMGDVALDLRGTILDRTEEPFGFALGFRTSFPTGTTDAPLSTPGVGWELQAIADRKFGPVLLAANLGTRGVPRTELVNTIISDQFFSRVGAGYEISENNGVSLDFNGNFPYAMLASDAVSEDPQGASVPIEGLLGGWQRMTGDYFLQLGAGTGVTPGIGSPTFRAVLSVVYKPAPGPFDLDGDGIVDEEDECPEVAEDPDGFEDANGCPDPDNDADGIVDVEDGCPMQPEDKDEWEDTDGCPDPSRQVRVTLTDPTGGIVPNAKGEIVENADRARGEVSGEGVLDLHPSAYGIVAMAEGYETAATNFDVTLGDSEQLVNVVLTPVVPVGQVRVRVTDEVGNPLPGTTAYFDQGDKLGVVDGLFEGTMPAGEYHVTVGAGPEYANQRVDFKVNKDKLTKVDIVLKKSLAAIIGDRIEIKDSVYFRTGRASIQEKSWGLLDEVALILLEHPEIEKLRIEGHTDSRGSASSNKHLSNKRAASVMKYLIEMGVPGDRLHSIGYGEEKPLDPRENAEAWEKNRRVDFFIESWAEGH